MTSNKTTEQLIPSDFREWAEGAKKYLKDEDLMIAYISGAFDSYRHLHSLPPSPVGEAGPKWVKASERLPSNPGSPQNHFRVDGEHKVNGNFHYSVDDEMMEGEIVFTVQGFGCFNNYQIEKEKFSSLEWLEERSSPNPSRVGEISPALPRWVKASERLPLHKGHWVTKKYGDHDNDFPVRMRGRYSMANIFDESPKDAPVHDYMLKFDGEEHFETQFSEIEWLEEAPPTPAPEVKEDQYDQWHPQGYSGKNAPPDPVKDTPVGQGDSLEPCVCVDKIGDNAGCTHPHCSRYASPSLAEQPAHVPDPKEEIPEEVIGIVYDKIFIPTKNEPGGEYPSAVCDFDDDEQAWVPGDRFVKSIAGPVAIMTAAQYYALQSTIATLTYERDTARQDLQKMIDDLGAKSEEAMQYRKGLEKVRDDPNKHAAIREFIDTVLGKYPQL